MIWRRKEGSDSAAIRWISIAVVVVVVLAALLALFR